LRYQSWIASRSLSSGAHSRDPLARNDGSGCLKNEIRSTLRPSSPAKAGDPVRRGLSALSRTLVEYWIARWSL
jgi:hypothetical protein